MEKINANKCHKCGKELTNTSLSTTPVLSLDADGKALVSCWKCRPSRIGKPY